MHVHVSTAKHRGASPWTLRQKVKMLAWEYSWALFCSWTPKPLNAWRLIVLRLFGARAHPTAFVHQRARIQIPWNIVLCWGSCIGDRAVLYSLDLIVVGRGSVVAQEAYLCTGGHLFTEPAWPLFTMPIVVGRNVFVGARAFVMAGARIGANSIVGANAVVTKSVPAGEVWAGNPARKLRTKSPEQA